MSQNYSDKRNRIKTILTTFINKTDYLKSYNPIIIPEGKNKFSLTIKINDRNHSVRVNFLKNIFDYIKTKEENVTADFVTRNWRVNVGGVYLYCKASNNVGSSFTLKDYIGSYSAIDEIEIKTSKGNTQTIKCYKFDDSESMRSSIEKTIASNKKFNQNQRDVVSNLFNIQKEGTPGGSNVSGLQGYGGLLISFGELFIPWLFLSQKYKLTIGNKRINPKCVYFPVSSTNATIDCIVSYGDMSKGEYVAFSAKYGAGHAKSVLSAIKEMQSIDESDDCFKTIKDLYDKRFNKVEVLWETFLPTYKNSNGTVTKHPHEILKDIRDNISNLKKYNIENYKNLLERKTNHDSEKVKSIVKYIFDEYYQQCKSKFSDFESKEVIKNNFPFSLNYFCYDLLAKYIEGDKSRLSRFKYSVLGGDYYQYRIDQNKANRGIFDFSISDVSKVDERTIKFHIGCASTDISSKYDLGYRIL